ncbi:hypothetical protein [Aestuariivivens sediminicola]|uniref:hypothetical protein n=1 Tax=Aestuariivivens sediminicola TaxID=2913560 RepID=UPI001F566226|nr:hypothetical protein [Aestuariivivens sediminicola]
MVLVFNSRLKELKSAVFIAHLFLFLPIVEAILKGTRKPFIEIFLIIVVCHLVFNFSSINLKKIIITFFAVISLMVISASILYQRESKYITNPNEYYHKILNAKYNDLMPLKTNVKSFFYDNAVSNRIKSLALASLQAGQYVIHGIYEFNHIIDDDIPKSFGKYTFYAPIRFLNKINLIPKIKAENPSPREIVFLTAFGGLFLDFGWGALFYFFLIGAIQKFVYLKSGYSIFYRAILVYFLIINVFLPIFNYIRGAGIYPFLAFGILLFVSYLREKRLHEESFNT